MMQLILIILTKRKEMIYYCESATYQPYIMGFSLTSPSGVFTNKFLHVNINNKIILINRKKHTQVLIVLLSHKQ
jgi:hypothetical protein